MNTYVWLLLLNTAAFPMEPIACFEARPACVREGRLLKGETFIPYGPPDVSVHCRRVPRDRCPASRPLPRH